MHSSRDLEADLLTAEAAIDDLQKESMELQRSTRQLKKERESMMSQLAHAMTSDKVAEIEIQSLNEEKERLREEVEVLRGGEVHVWTRQLQVT